jgi:hypothetical protein
LNLISAEETQCWLHACGLTLDDMAQYVVRVLAEDAATDLPGGTEWPDEVFDVLWADALFDNALVSLVEPLTLEALALAAKAADAESVTSHTSMFTERCEKMPPQLRAIVRPRLDQMVALRASFAIFAAEQTDAALSSALAQHRTDTIQLTYSELQFSNINVANEAYLCAIIDGADFDDLAERTKTACTQHEIFAGDLDTMLQSTLVSAQPGEIVKAYAEDEYRLIMLDSKNDPDLTAAPVRTRLTRRLVATALHSQYGSRLKWQIPILTS